MLTEQILAVSEELLFSLEAGDVPLDKIITKCKKLARMRNDYKALNWFTLELHGYKDTSIPNGIELSELFVCAKRAGRTTVVQDSVTKKSDERYWIESIVELEAMVDNNLKALENLKTPSQFTPAIRKHSYESIYTGSTSGETVVERYQDVLNVLTTQRNYIMNIIKDKKSLISKIRNNVYDYVLNINLQLKFETITESVFQSTKELVDQKLLSICPDAIKKFLAAYDRLKSKNPEEWSQALSSCRNILKGFADYVYPAKNETIKLSDKTVISVTEDKYKNRLLAFIDSQFKGNKKKLLKSRLKDLSNRIYDLNDILSQGAKNEMELIDVNICVLDTYLLIGSLLSIVPPLNAKK
ncbi:MAG: hypothetical protein P9X22_07265 [Candidatus Zapsychrus exili]|nr:hypothetical protein [Candidatus Zapsychrus exili]